MIDAFESKCDFFYQYNNKKFKQKLIGKIEHNLNMPIE